MDPQAPAPTGNPFTPGFGVLPPVMPGRDDLFNKIQVALASGPKHPAFTSLLLGPRGAGKTAALSAIQDDAEAAGWVVCESDELARGADVPLHEALAEVAQDKVDEISPPRSKRLGSLRIGPVSLGWAPAASGQRRGRLLERTLSELAKLVVEQGGSGVLVIVDEFHNATEAGTSALASAIQRLAKKQGKLVALLSAGLPHIEHTLLASQGFTFFQRCKRHRIENLLITEAKDALSIPLADQQISMGNGLLYRAAAATRGYPYAVQSLGFHLWEQTGPGQRVQEHHLLRAIEEMQRDVDENVMSPIWHQLSPASRDFLAAMSLDAGPSRVSDLALRLGMSPSAVSVYRARLIGEGAISPAGHGLVEFASLALSAQAQAHRAEMSASDTANGAGSSESADSRDRDSSAAGGTRRRKARCGVMLPLAQRPCVRPRGHNGPHRST